MLLLRSDADHSGRRRGRNLIGAACLTQRPTALGQRRLQRSFSALCAGLFEELLQDFVGLGPNDGVSGDDECGH